MSASAVVMACRPSSAAAGAARPHQRNAPINGRAHVNARRPPPRNTTSAQNRTHARKVHAAAITVSTETETSSDGSASQVFNLDLGGPQSISQSVSCPFGSKLVPLEVLREGGMGMVLEEVVDKPADGKPIPSVKVVESRMSGGGKVGGKSAAPSNVSTVVVEVVPGSNAEKAGVQVGDKIRFFTAVFTVSDPIDILSYYANPPKKENRRGVYVADGQPFDKTMAALVSNGQPHVTAKAGVYDVADSVLVVVERSDA